ncbi:MAG: hypothetical protein HWD62_03885 [Cyclobacteriaceae bacterium]|nr:MAG: hypothetical protein HWD62_03885 [Cyclobacteriaceae bacterium]
MATAISMLAIYFVVVACQDQIMNEISDSTLTQAEFPDVVKMILPPNIRLNTRWQVQLYGG